MDSLHLTTAHTATDTRIFDKEAISLMRAGFDVGILAHNAPDKKRDGIRFVDLGSPTSRVERWQSIPDVVRTAKRLEASVYHFHDPELIPVGLYLSATTDSSVIYDVHEDFGHKATGRGWIPELAKPVFSYGIPYLEQFAARQFDAIVTATESIEEKFADVNNNVSVVHNFPRTDGLPVAKEYKNRSADHVLVYVGGLNELRGIHRMLEVLNILCERGRDVELWALGAWSTDTDKRRAEEFIANTGLEHRTHFPGYIDYEEMFQHLYSADLGLALLDTEQFETAIPTKQFEYLYSGLPVVATPLDAVVKFLPEKYRYIVPQDDAYTTADTVEAALEVEYDTAEMQSLVEKKYSWKSEAESLISLYNKLL